MICIGAAGLVNYLVDPARLFDSSHSTERDIALLLRQGPVGVVHNYDERLLQKFRLEVEPVAPLDFLVIGSSRSMQFGEHILHASTLNLSVSGVSIEDYVAILDMARKFPAKTIVLGVDPWLLNINNDQGEGWRTLAVEYAMGVNRLTHSTGKNNSSGHSEYGAVGRKFLQLLNFGYTKASLRTLQQNLKNPGPSKPFLKLDDSPETDVDVIRKDGSRVHNLRYASRPTDEIRKIALKDGDPPIYALERYFNLDSDRLSLLVCLVQRLKQRSNVWLFLPPYHPEAYRKIISRVPIVQRVEDTLKTLANDEGVRVVGSYDPRMAGCVEADFFDGMHPKGNCLIKLLAINPTPVSTLASP